MPIPALDLFKIVHIVNKSSNSPSYPLLIPLWGPSKIVYVNNPSISLAYTIPFFIHIRLGYPLTIYNIHAISPLSTISAKCLGTLEALLRPFV